MEMRGKGKFSEGKNKTGQRSLQECDEKRIKDKG
jgi:hypothetical protein